MDRPPDAGAQSDGDSGRTKATVRLQVCLDGWAADGELICTKDAGSCGDTCARVRVTFWGSDDVWRDVAHVRLRVVEQRFDRQSPATLMDEYLATQGLSATVLEAFQENVGFDVVLEGFSAGGTALAGTRDETVRVDSAEEGEPPEAQAITVPVGRLNAFISTESRAGEPALLARGRFGQTVTNLSGMVLIAGGLSFKDGHTGDFVGVGSVAALYRDAEIYDSETGTFTPTAPMAQARAFHTATRLSDGTALIAGGITTDGTTAVSANSFERYRPGTNQFEAVPTTLTEGRAGHTATMLDEYGNLFLAGGFAVGAGGEMIPLATADVLCLEFPCIEEGAAAGIVFTDAMAEARAFHTANLAKMGEESPVNGVFARKGVLLIGGDSVDGPSATADTFWLSGPPGFEQVRSTESSGMSTRRTRHTATYVESQSLIHVVGGFSSVAHDAPVQVVEVFDVRTRGFQSAGFSTAAARGAHAVVQLPGGVTLIAGGFGEGGALASAEMISENRDPTDPSKKLIDGGPVADMLKPRAGLSLVVLSKRSVLVVGGVDSASSLEPTGELYTPL